MVGELHISMGVAILLVVGLDQDQTHLNDRDVPYGSAINEAALNAKAVANDQRGFLKSSVAAESTRCLRIMLGCALGALTVGGAVAYWLVRSIAGPISRLTSRLGLPS